MKKLTNSQKAIRGTLKPSTSIAGVGHAGRLDSIPEPPEIFENETSKQIWTEVAAELHTRGHLFASTLPYLELYVFTWHQLRIAMLAIREKGMLVTDKNGDKRRNPYILIKSKAQQELLDLEKRLGITPYSRDRLPPGEDPEDARMAAVRDLAAKFGL
jgi:P27 family predicted phage terminase small subunit